MQGSPRLTLFSCKITVLRSNVFELPSGRVDNLHIARKVLVTIYLGELPESLVRDLGDIQLVVTDRQQIVIDVLENEIGNVAVWRCGVRETGAIVKILACRLASALCANDCFHVHPAFS